MNTTFNQKMQQELDAIAAEGLFKKERIITGPQGSVVDLNTGQHLINLCANNYLGLSSHPEVIQAAKDALDTHGFGMSSVRFICGTQDVHKTLEKKIADFYGTEDTILYAAAFDANGGVFEPLLGAEDAIISDALNHASIIDGIRLCKAQRYRYANGDLADLETQLKEARAQGAKNILIVTDGVFSMDGLVAPLDGICDLADQYDALVMVDECHAAGFLGARGRGSLEAKGVLGRVDIITGTLGKALGGAMGGYTTASKPIIEMLRQRSRPYLFSNSLAPSIVGASIKVFELIDKDTSYRDRLMDNTAYFRAGIKALGFDIIEGEAAIIPIMLYEATLAQEMATRLMDHGVYVIGFFYPVVPKGKARIRVQLSAALSREELDRALEAFKIVGQSLNII
ncbi:MAG: glycine C-acetyltransferase [Flavobacteriaceae bacterium]|jgi:glycine C-acetyltransferase